MEGKCSFTGTVMFNGRLKGALEAGGAVIVGSTAVVHAEVRAPVVIIDGTVVGDVAATERIELRARARLVGDLKTPILVIEEGAVFEGRTAKPGGPVNPTSRTPAAVPDRRVASREDANIR